MMILNEENYAKNILLGKNTEVKSVIKLIGYITRYNYYVLDKNDEVNYQDTVKWLSNTYEKFDETCYSRSISKAIQWAGKYPFYKIDRLEITKFELDTIKSLNNLRAEKMLFVLLCMAKQQSISRGFNEGLVQYSMVDLCKMARISVPKDDREYILFDILQKGLISCPKKNDTKCLKVNFITDDEPGIILEETDCQELAYAYLNWRNQKGFKKCIRCGRLFKQKQDQKKCQYCEEELMHDRKEILCIDCGVVVELNNKDTATCRCDECYNKYRKQKNLEAVKKYQGKHSSDQNLIN